MCSRNMTEKNIEHFHLRHTKDLLGYFHQAVLNELL